MNPFTVILQGGYALEVDPSDTDPAVQTLITGGVFTSPQNQVLELTAAGGERLRFRAEAVVAVVMPAEEGKPGSSRQWPSPPDAQQRSSIVYAHAAPGAVRPYVVIEDFLSAAEHEEVLRLTLSAREKFVASTVDSDEANYRASRVLTGQSPIFDLMRRRIEAALPAVAAELGQTGILAPANVDPSSIECQVTAHNDGDFYRVHNNSGSPRTQHRTISYVYYFLSQPKRFQGGELRLYEVAISEGLYVAGESYWLMEPGDNAVVFFPESRHARGPAGDLSVEGIRGQSLQRQWLDCIGSVVVSPHRG